MQPQVTEQLSDLVHFDSKAWRTSVEKCAHSDLATMKQMVGLCLAAREAGLDPDVAREVFQAAYAGAMARLTASSIEDARRMKTVQNRVSDCLAIFNAATLPAEVPSGLQAAAKACREANPKPGRQVAKPVSDGAKALRLVREAIAYASRQAEGNALALDVIKSMADLATALDEAMKAEEGV